MALTTTRISCLSAKNIVKLITIPEAIWRKSAAKHRDRIWDLVEPGLLTPPNSSLQIKSRRSSSRSMPLPPSSAAGEWTALDPNNPIYNFLIEYYGLKGAKGLKRLARWSPDPSLLLLEDEEAFPKGIRIQHVSSYDTRNMHDEVLDAAMTTSHNLGGIFLENATIEDIGGTLHLRGAMPVTASKSSLSSELNIHGVLYNPALFYNRNVPAFTPESKKKLLKIIAPFQWYSSILERTLRSEPILHCHGLHEWAMQYRPAGAPLPPSAKYQSHIPLRVSQQVINSTVERRGISCTHVDALRFFAPAAAPLNHHGSSLERTDQLRLEQKACLHSHMDLLKIVLKLAPFVDTDLVADALAMSLAARKLDIEASPYDATGYGAGVVPVETKEGRALYKARQKELMLETEPVRMRLLDSYHVFMNLAFDEKILGCSAVIGANSGKDSSIGPFAAPERFSRAEPGGKPWRLAIAKK